MKVRNDFVTNSSSSSFVLAKKDELNEKQKEAILKYIEKEFLGKKILTPDSTEEEVERVFEEDDEFYRDDVQENTRKALKEGKSIHTGWVTFDECEYNYSSVFEDIWKILEENGEGDFVAIKDDLSY